MRQPGHYLGFNVLLDVLPLLSFVGRSGRKKFAEIARGDIGDDAAVLYGVVVVDYYCSLALEGGRQQKTRSRQLLNALLYETRLNSYCADSGQQKIMQLISVPGSEGAARSIYT